MKMDKSKCRGYLGMVETRLTLLHSSKPKVSITQARFLNLAAI